MVDELDPIAVDNAVRELYGKKPATTSATTAKTTSTGPKLEGLNPDLLARVQEAQAAYCKQFGRDLPITRGVSTREEQEKLVQRAKTGEKNIFMPTNPANFPNKQIFHADAVDIDSKVPESFLNKFGIYRPLGSKDPVHAVLMPTQKTESTAQVASTDDFDLSKINSMVKDVYDNPPKEESKGVKASVGKFLSNLGASAASMADVAAGVIPAAVGIPTYATARLFQKSPEEAAQIQQKVMKPLEQPFGKAFGVTESPAYKGELTRQLTEFIGENVGKGADWIAEKTGMPKSDVEYYMNLGMFAAPAVGGIVKDVGAAALKSKPVQAVARPIIEEGKMIGEAVSAATPQPVKNVLGRTAEAVLPGVTSLKPIVTNKATTAETVMKGVGAAEVESAALKQARANELLIPMGDDYTKAQLTRNPTDVRYESDTAKLPVVGDPFQAKFALQNEKLRNNLQAEVEHTGAQSYGTNPADFGQKVISEPFQKYKNDRHTEVNNAYTAADAAGETSQLVPYKSVSDFIKSKTENRPTIKKENPLYAIVEEELKANDPKGTGQISIKQMEDIRKLINQEVDPQKKGSVFVGKEFKKHIDQATENAGGDLYKQARNLNTKFANDFENIAIIRDINRNKNGLTDRVIPLEQLADRLIFKGPGSDLKSVLATFEKMGPEGQQIITELKGYAADQIREKVTANVQLDAAGKPYVSTAALNKIIKTLNTSGKLEMLFGKQQAQRYRTLNDVTKELQTVPKDTTNPSGTTASFIAMGIEGAGQALLSGIPVPVASGIHYLKKSYNTKKALKKANEYANPNVKISDMVKPEEKPLRIEVIGGGGQQ
jgi:hypothetical protein